MPRRSPAPSRGTITRVSRIAATKAVDVRKRFGTAEALPVSPSPTSRREHRMLDSNLSGKDRYIEWLTGLARAHQGRGRIPYRLLIFCPAAAVAVAGGMTTRVTLASNLPAQPWSPVGRAGRLAAKAVTRPGS